MTLKYLINIFLIIFVLHIILINIDFNLKLGKTTTTEYFANGENYDKSIVSGPSGVNFLIAGGSQNDNDAFQKKMMKYIQADVKPVEATEFERKNNSDVKPNDEYASNENVPNFESNVVDISKFYNINFDNMSEDDLKKATPICNGKETNIAKISGNDSMCDGKTVRQAQELPLTWQYKNELPMNGGSMNGIFGFDNLESQFASFGGVGMNLQPADDNNFKNIPHDDLRKPVVYN